METTATIEPVSVTRSTLHLLAQQENYAELLALYMAFVEVASWQKNNSIKATKSFMLNRLKWGGTKYSERKAKLIELGLIENITKKEPGTNKIKSHYVLVKHMVNIDSHLHSQPEGGFHHQVDNSATSANDLNISANNINKNTSSYKKSNELISLVNRVIGRQFRTLPAKGSKKTLETFSLEEIEQALVALKNHDWHRERLYELSIDYLTRPTTIDKFLQIKQSKPKPTAKLPPPPERKQISPEQRQKNVERIQEMKQGIQCPTSS